MKKDHVSNVGRRRENSMNLDIHCEDGDTDALIHKHMNARMRRSTNVAILFA